MLSYSSLNKSSGRSVTIPTATTSRSAIHGRVRKADSLRAIAAISVAALALLLDSRQDSPANPRAVTETAIAM